MGALETMPSLYPLTYIRMSPAGMVFIPVCKSFSPQRVRPSGKAQAATEISQQIPCVENQTLRNLPRENVHWFQLCLICHETLERAVHWQMLSIDFPALRDTYTQNRRGSDEVFFLWSWKNIYVLCSFRYPWLNRVGHAKGVGRIRFCKTYFSVAKLIVFNL